MIRMESEKKKLTLSINSEVIEKAKKLGLNLSEVTENSLKLYSLGHDNDKIVTSDKLRDVYTDVLKKISEILKKWETSLQIGSSSNPFNGVNYTYILYQDEVRMWSSESDESPEQTWHLNDKNLPIHIFDEPDKIITNLINELYETANKNKEVLDKLQILKNILELSGLSK
ncbi:MAG: type II toxin-antitoxin system CcdA family antitoxin [Candidatus Methanoperedens sp.]|nr:type II toxin-antitoxin system CcdA family antitoxin [Candidatus Methanoperedens sp.]MCZ7370813.1 type II toxin-antitoxin system CcdA family antitoxin [Candidatus Methanoperedens sp.]